MTYFHCVYFVVLFGAGALIPVLSCNLGAHAVLCCQTQWSAVPAVVARQEGAAWNAMPHSTGASPLGAHDVISWTGAFSNWRQNNVRIIIQYVLLPMKIMKCTLDICFPAELSWKSPGLPFGHLWCLLGVSFSTILGGSVDADVTELCTLSSCVPDTRVVSSLSRPLSCLPSHPSLLFPCICLQGPVLASVGPQVSHYIFLGLIFSHV